jgi:RNA polymerase sigma factor (sigma-70 family)
MAEKLPRELDALLNARDSSSRDRAWEEFLRRYNRYLLGTAQFVCREYDDRMDAYRHMIESLAQDDFKRLREYCVRADSRFTTWLVVVARRLCHDFQRTRYGRERAGSGVAARETREARRRLQDLIAVELRPGELPDRGQPTPERRLREEQLSGALASALAELAPEDRLLLKLRYEDGLAVRKVAEVMRLDSEFVVYRRQKRLLARLRDCLEEEGVHDPYP